MRYEKWLLGNMKSIKGEGTFEFYKKYIVLVTIHRPLPDVFIAQLKKTHPDRDIEIILDRENERQWGFKIFAPIHLSASIYIKSISDTINNDIYSQKKNMIDI